MLGDKLSQRIPTGTSGAITQNKVVTAIAGGTSFVPAEGDYFLFPTVGLTFEVQDDAGIWVSPYGVNNGGLITCDGVNQRIRNTNASGGASLNASTQKLG